MKKFFRLLCLAAILCVGYLALTQPRDGQAPAIVNIGSEAEEIAGQVKGMYEEYGSAAVEQADQVIEEAVDSAMEGAKEGFLQSIKESVSSFFDGLFAETD